MIFQELQIIRGDTFELEVTITDESGKPVNITGAKVFFTIKLNPEEADEQSALQVVQQEHIAPEMGRTLIVAEAAQTAQLQPRRSCVYDIQVVKDGKVCWYTSGTTLPQTAPTSGYTALTGSAVPAVGFYYDFNL